MSIKYQWETWVDSWDFRARLAEGFLSQSLTDEKWDLENLGLSEPTQNSSACHFKPNSNLPELEIKGSAYRKIKKRFENAIKRHLRNLYKASSVMIYMQMNTNVLGIHYVGARFDQIQTDHRERNPQTRATRETEGRIVCPFLVCGRGEMKENTILFSHLRTTIAPRATVWDQRWLKRFGSLRCPQSCKCVLKKTWAGFTPYSKMPQAIVSFQCFLGAPLLPSWVFRLPGVWSDPLGDRTGPWAFANQSELLKRFPSS